MIGKIAIEVHQQNFDSEMIGKIAVGSWLAEYCDTQNCQQNGDMKIISKIAMRKLSAKLRHRVHQQNSDT